MRFLPRSSLVAESLAVCWILVAACTTARVIQPARLSRPHAPARVTVTSAERSPVVFDSVHVISDSLMGFVNGAPQRIPLSDATVIRARQVSQVRTAALAVAVTGTLMAASLFVAEHAWGDHPGPLPGGPVGLACECNFDSTCKC
jgi:hypothetical protein